MNINKKIQAVALCGLVGLCSYVTVASAEEIIVKASPGNVWTADCDRCEAQPSGLKIFVEPRDIIVFVQNDPSTKHGIVGQPAQVAKIALRGEANDASKIAVELGAPTMFGVQQFQKIGSERATEEFPVEITRIQINDNFSGSLALFCNVHGPNMSVMLEKN